MKKQTRVTHVTGPKGERVRVVTNTKADVRRMYVLVNTSGMMQWGHTTKLAIPYSVSPYEIFMIGSRRFRISGDGNHNKVMALDGIPDSWLVDLSQDVEELQTEPEAIAIEETAHAIALARASSLHMHIRFQQLRAGEHHAI